MKNEELKPCPFCGGKAKMCDNSYEHEIIDPITLAVVDADFAEAELFWVECNECHCMSHTVDSEQKAEDAWNRRAEKNAER